VITPEAEGQSIVKAATEPVHEPATTETRNPQARSLAQLESSQTAMRDATKWLVAAAGAVGAVVVAGLQLRDLPHGSLATLVALVGVGAALLAVAFILYRAAGVLVAGYTTFGSIADLEGGDKFRLQEEKVEKWSDRLKPLIAKTLRPATPEKLREKMWRIIRQSPAAVALGVLSAYRKLTLRYAKVEDMRIDELINYLNQDTFFFTQGLAANINDLSYALRETDKEILSIRGERIGGKEALPKPPSPAPPELKASDRQTLLEKADWRRERLESAMGVTVAFANQRLLEQRFRKLIHSILFGGAVVALGAGAFAVAPKIGKPAPLSITQPTRVTVRVVGNNLGKSCPPGTLLQGVAVGGTWQEPIVVTEEAGSCPAQQVTLNPGQAIAVPVLDPSP
jgi:hypothetical protein